MSTLPISKMTLSMRDMERPLGVANQELAAV